LTCDVTHGVRGTLEYSFETLEVRDVATHIPGADRDILPPARRLVVEHDDIMTGGKHSVGNV
jgi:hypothetical protein